MSEGRKPGRPRLEERRRVQVGFRIRPALYAELAARSAATGRSMTQEVELLLEKGLRDEGVETRLDEILSLIKPVRRVA